MSVATEQEIAALRAFNRLYTAKLGLLDALYDGGPFSLSEARILFELAHGYDLTAAQIGRILRLDPAQVSRTLKRFSQRGLVETRPNPVNARQQWLALTPSGQSAFAQLERNTRQAVGDILSGLTPFSRARLLDAAATITSVIGQPCLDVVLRPLQPGDLGLVTARQSILYAREYGWGRDYEALVAQILADFHRTFDPGKDDAWIAENDGVMVGSIFLVSSDTAGVGKLRLLYVEPDARGMGVGQRLVEACVARARALGYAQLDLWTVSALSAAGRLYERAGFKLRDQSPVRRFGYELVDQTWSLTLT